LAPFIKSGSEKKEVKAKKRLAKGQVAQWG